MYETHYLSYLLRLWKVKAADGTHWRAMLESPLTGERLGFPDLEALYAYLDSVTEDPTIEDVPSEGDENSIWFSSCSSPKKNR